MEYPKGAIKSISELISYKGKTIYSYSRMHSYANESFRFTAMVMDENEKFVPYKEGMNFRFFQVGNDMKSILDKHILPQDYNEWFLFGNEEDAKSYLEGDTSKQQ